jgi:2-polyprenyl-3-methyl-5-hydroxy-6-metoxy-1,4-benzoquinol methylase
VIDAHYRSAYETAFRDILAQAAPGHYDEMALPSYTHANPAMSWLFWRRLDAAFCLAGDLAGKAVLDFGCGGAVTFRHLQACDCRITGCDPEARELAQEVCRRLGIAARIVAHIEDAADGRYDRILALDVLEHVDGLERYIERFAALLAPQGRVIVSGPTENALYKLGRALAGFSGHYHVRNIYDIEAAFRRAGFRALATKTLYPPLPLFRVSAWQAPAR